MRLRTTLTLSSLALVAGCQSYEPSPLDLDAYRAAWLEQDPSDQAVADFARALQEHGLRDASTPFDPDDGLSLGEAEVVGLVYNPELRIARLRAGVAAASAEYAHLWPDPEFGIDVLRVAESVPDPWVIPMGLSFTIPISGRIEVEKRRANAEAAATLDAVARDEWDARMTLRQAWIAWSADRMRVDLAEDILERLDVIVDATSRLADVGELTRTEAALFALERATIRNELTLLRGDVAARKQAIHSQLGLVPEAPIDLELALAVPGPPIGPDAFRDRIAGHNLALVTLRTEYDVAEHKLNREIRKQYPDLTIGPAYEWDEGQSRIGMLAGIPIPILNANRRGIAEARAERDVAQAAFETEYQRLVGRLVRATARHDAAQSQREDLEATLVPLADRQVEDARQLLNLGEGLGEGSAIVLLESIVRAYSTKLRLIDARLAEAETATDIVALLGPDQVMPRGTGTDGNTSNTAPEATP